VAPASARSRSLRSLSLAAARLGDRAAVRRGVAGRSGEGEGGSGGLGPGSGCLQLPAEVVFWLGLLDVDVPALGVVVFEVVFCFDRLLVGEAGVDRGYLLL